MKQLTIACSDDLEERVLAVLDEAAVEGFIRWAGATGNRFTRPGDPYRVMTWAASVLLVPAVDDETAATVAAALAELAASCGSEPCLRVTVATVERAV